MAVDLPVGHRVAETVLTKRTVHRRCPVCDRGHMCFPAEPTAEPDIEETPREVALGTRLTLVYDTVGSWHGAKARILAGATVTIKSLRTHDNGDVRAMVELSDGDTYWVGVQQLTRGLTPR